MPAAMPTRTHGSPPPRAAAATAAVPATPGQTVWIYTDQQPGTTIISAGTRGFRLQQRYYKRLGRPATIRASSADQKFACGLIPKFFESREEAEPYLEEVMNAPGRGGGARAAHTPKYTVAPSEHGTRSGGRDEAAASAAVNVRRTEANRALALSVKRVGKSRHTFTASTPLRLAAAAARHDRARVRTAMAAMRTAIIKIDDI